jgi:pimeloyl-ACP methyl ester carboxylesterase
MKFYASTRGPIRNIRGSFSVGGKRLDPFASTQHNGGLCEVSGCCVIEKEVEVRIAPKIHERNALRVLSYEFTVTSLKFNLGFDRSQSESLVGLETWSRKLMKKQILFVTIVLASVTCAAFAQKQTLTLQPCELGEAKGAQCGTFQVFENRATRKGRKIDLKIVVLPATSSARLPDPLFYIPGGPGSSATEDAEGVASIFVKIRERRDLIFLDQRGTGGSNPLNCELFNPSDPQSYFGYFFPLAEVKKCREQLEAKANLTLYTTSIAMDDLDDVRAALGYDRINVFGGSYGTRAALVYLRQHPEHLRTLTLQGVAPTNLYMPYDFPQSNERALLGIVSECAADAGCNAAFPNLRTELNTVLDRLLQGPIEIEVKTRNPPGPTKPSSVAKVKLSRDLAAEAIRYMLYSPASAGRIPLFLHQAAAGNFIPLAQAALQFRQQIVASGSNGLYLSITCAEDLPWIKPGEGERLAANTFLGDYRLRQQREACSLWPRANIPADYFNQIHSSKPTLILTGDLDPVTPPANGDATARNLSDSLHVVVPHGGHGFNGLEGIECIVGLMTRFVAEGTTKGLDTGCVKGIRRKGFVLK